MGAALVRWDAVFIGGGLANLLAAYRLKVVRPELRFKVLEQEKLAPPSHTWSFHESDLTPENWSWFSFLVDQAWDGYEVRFPQYSRQLRGKYFSIDSLSFFQRLREKLGDSLVLDVEVESVTRQEVVSLGHRWSTECVFDGRGWRTSPQIPCAYQKFLGRRLKFTEPHGVTRPLIMDARVPQRDGYRFIYCLPWSPDEMLVEDTRYSASWEVDVPAFRTEIDRYCEGRGWKIQSSGYEEIGCLPIPLSGEAPRSQEGAILWGSRAGYFQPTTGYSLPDAVRQAERLTEVRPWTRETVVAFADSAQQEHWRRGRYLRALNRMMFFAATAEDRYEIFQRFYRLPEDLIERFYAGRLTFFDQARILSGRPPVPVWPALQSLWKKGVLHEGSSHV